MVINTQYTFYPTGGINTQDTNYSIGGMIINMQNTQDTHNSTRGGGIVIDTWDTN